MYISFSLSLLIDFCTHTIAHIQSLLAAHAQMLPTDQSGLIELRLAVLRPANDRRDISAASGMFVRRCARVNEQREDEDEKAKEERRLGRGERQVLHRVRVSSSCDARISLSFFFSSFFLCFSFRKLKVPRRIASPRFFVDTTFSFTVTVAHRLGKLTMQNVFENKTDI